MGLDLWFGVAALRESGVFSCTPKVKIAYVAFVIDHPHVRDTVG